MWLLVETKRHFCTVFAVLRGSLALLSLLRIRVSCDNGFKCCNIVARLVTAFHGRLYNVVCAKFKLLLLCLHSNTR